MAEHPLASLSILEGGFRPRPEQLAAYLQRHEEFLPYALRQLGFHETYGGPIAGSPWWFFVAKFDTLAAMERWQHDRAHREVQDQARRLWWTAYYLRKGCRLAPGDAATGWILCETMLLCDTPLTPEAQEQVPGLLLGALESGVLPYETLSGERGPTPGVWAGPLAIAPQRAPFHYSLLTYWRSTADCTQWHKTAPYQALARHGLVRTSLFVMRPERQSRMGVRPDRLQREWIAEQE